jgi:hypothetical protein
MGVMVVIIHLYSNILNNMEQFLIKMNLIKEFIIQMMIVSIQKNIKRIIKNSLMDLCVQRHVMV